MKKAKEWYGNLNLKNKLRFSYIVLILIPVTLICIIYYSSASKSIIDVAKQNILDVTVKNTEIIDRQLKAAENSAMYLNVDPDVFEILESVNDVPDSELLVRDRRIKSVLQKTFTGEYILSANIMTRRYVFGENSQLIIPARQFFESDLYQQILGYPGEARWLPTYQVAEEFLLDYSLEEGTVFTLAQELNPVLIDPERPSDVRYMGEETDAVLLVNFSEGIMDDMFAGSNSIRDSFYCIAARDGHIVAHSDPEKTGTREELPWLAQIGEENAGSMILRHGGQQVVVCYAVSETTGWVAATVTPVNSLLNNVSKLQILTVAVWLLLFVLAMILSALFSSRITKPVGQLVDAMKRVGQGDFSWQLPTHGTDEMQYLTEKYNEMGRRIQVLIEENYESEIRKKETEIMALNLQLNPHFLYNTLNIMNMMALEEGNMEISKMLLSLSDMLQYTFRNRQELVVFEEEYLWLQNYLHIMQIRFEGKFTVRYEVEKEIFRCQVPKLLLQPLVENAIVHGFRSMESGGVLVLRAARAAEDETMLLLEVEDNGGGMTEEELDNAMNGDHNRIGLSNAKQRLRLIYGERGTLMVRTGAGEGCCVCVEFPGGEAE